MTNSLVEAIVAIDEEKTLKLVRDRLAAGEDPLKILADARTGVEIFDKKFASFIQTASTREYSTRDLVFLGEILSQITELTKSKVSKEGGLKRVAICVIGTVAPDAHGFGKNIVSFMLYANGFDVHDLGVDVAAQKFVDKIKEVKPQVVALSGSLTPCISSMKNTVDAIEAAGLRKNVKIMVGGGRIDEHVSKFVKADGWGNDALTAVKMAKQWVGAD